MSERPAADGVSRVAVRQMLWLGLIGTCGFIALMAALSWASSLTSSGGEVLGAVNLERNAISIVLRQGPPQMDHTRMTDVVSGTLIAHLMEGLLRYDADGSLAPGVAERWEVRPDGATFWLREDARWSDGKPVTAHDFVFSWRTVVDPATASQYAFIFYVIKNAEAINTGKLPPEALGVRAVDDRTLEIELENPVAYFDKLVAFPTYMPLREDFYRSRGSRYAADAADMIFNGPFVMTRWVHGSSIRLEKNPLYWNQEAVKLDIIDIPYITSDLNATMNLFRDGQIAQVLGLSQPEVLEQALEERWPIGRFNDGSVWFLVPNQRPERLTSNFHLRKALQLINDPNELVNKVLKVPSYTVADSLFPSWLKGEKGFFKQEHPPPRITPDVEAARMHLEIAKQELGLDRIPPLVILADDTASATKQLEYLQDRYMRTLGLELRIDKQIFRQRLAKAEAGEFDLLVYGWGPDFDDPLTFGDLYASWNLNNHARYNNPALDAQVRIAQRSLDQGERMAAFAEIQRILIEDAVIFPNYERGQMFVMDPRLKGVVHRAIGAESDFTNAYLVANP